MTRIAAAACLSLVGASLMTAGNPESRPFTPTIAEDWSVFQPFAAGAANVFPYAAWITNAASLQPGTIAPGMIASAFGQNFAPDTVVAESAQLPETLGGITVEITDAANVTQAAPIFFVAPGQVNFQIPADTAHGRARVTVRRRDGSAIIGDTLVDRLSPGLFSVNSSGHGVGLIGATLVTASGAQAAIPVYTHDSTLQRSVAIPINLGAATDRVYLILYGTGIRGVRDFAAVQVQIGGKAIPTQSVGKQGDFVGMDQVNIGPLPKALAGIGEVAVEVSIEGRRSNPVLVNIQ